VHVAQGGVDTSLSGDSVGPGGEKLGDASGLESGFTEAERSSEAGSSSSDDDGVVLVVDDSVVSDQACAL